MAVAAAALLVALLLVPPGSDDRARWRPKGVVPTGVHVELEVLRASGVEIVPLARGGEVGLGETLLFRVRLSAPACVQLWLDGEQPRALLEQPVCLEPGAHTLAAGGEALGYGASAAGPLHFKVTTGNHPVSVGGGVESRFSVEVRGAER